MTAQPATLRPFFHIHDRVTTPDGPGLYQGLWVSFKQGAQTMIIVSHNPRDCPLLGVAEPCEFYYYRPEDVSPIEARQ